MSSPKPRRFVINPENLPAPPLLIGLMGPPGGGKTKSALRIGDGIARVRGGKPLLIDTEKGRSLKYHTDRPGGTHDFDYMQFDPPFIPAEFLAAIKQAIAHQPEPACVIVDSMSDEHEGEGGVLDWHDRVVPQFSGNEWAAWSKPKASRRELVSGIQQISVPLILTFRAREKTAMRKNKRGKEVPTQLGFSPIAPSEIVHTLDLTCLLPHRAGGKAVWNSPKEGEDFVIKLPEFLAPYIDQGAVLNEDLGERLARWQAGDETGARRRQDAGARRSPAEMVDDYVLKLDDFETLDALQAFQMSESTQKFIAKLKDRHPDLHDRVISANTRRAQDLERAGDSTDEPEEEKPDSWPEDTGPGQDDLQFPDDPDPGADQ